MSCCSSKTQCCQCCCEAPVQAVCNSAVVPLVGNKAPDFKLQAYHQHNFKEISLADFKGKWVIIVAYPLDFTFVCPTELLAYNDMLAEFEKNNCAVLGISTDSHFCHMNWCMQPRSQGGLGEDFKLPMLADVNHDWGRKYRCLVPNEGVLLRTLVMIDDEGIVRHETTNDLSVGRSPNESLRLLKAFQHSKKHGTVCPANFDEGAPDIDPSKPQEYFSKQK
ncbi:hypothetical protein P9112_001873 [Eukaryota sp. TZLM1-RC]